VIVLFFGFSFAVMVCLVRHARMRFSGHEILRKRIRLPAGSSRYLRLSWPTGKE
jgi:hypothetical protein